MKKSVLIACITLLMGSVRILAMLDSKPQGIIHSAKSKIVSLIAKCARTPQESNVLDGMGPIDSNDPDTRLVKDMRGCHQDANERYTRYIKLPLKQKKEESDHKAPQEVQQLSLRYAKTMFRPYNLRDWARFQYLKAFGFLTVYNGPAKNLPKDRGFDKTGFSACCMLIGGIYFKDSLTKDLSAEQRCALAHEVGHNVNGDTTIFNAKIILESHKEGSPVWFFNEYCAQAQMVTVLFKLKDSEALDFTKKEYPDSVLPYKLGIHDTCNLWENKKPLPLLKKRYQDYLEYSPCEKEIHSLVNQRVALHNNEFTPLFKQADSIFEEIKKLESTITDSRSKDSYNKLCDQLNEIRKELTQKNKQYDLLNQKINELKKKLQEIL